MDLIGGRSPTGLEHWPSMPIAAGMVGITWQAHAQMCGSMDLMASYGTAGR